MLECDHIYTWEGGCGLGEQVLSDLMGWNTYMWKKESYAVILEGLLSQPQQLDQRCEESENVTREFMCSIL